MKNRIITISREFGSGGRTIGRTAAEELGIPCYDSELLQKIAIESGFDENYIKEAGEYAPGGLLTSAFSHNLSGPNNADYLWNIQYKVITDIAKQGPCAAKINKYNARKADNAAKNLRPRQLFLMKNETCNDNDKKRVCSINNRRLYSCCMGKSHIKKYIL